MHCGHVQVVWKNSQRVGCGWVTNCPGTWRYIVACEYDPPGNYAGAFPDNVFPPGKLAVEQLSLYCVLTFTPLAEVT